MKRITTQFAIFCLLLAGTFAQAQNTFPSTGAAGIGTLTPASSSLLEVKSTSKGVLFPRMTKTQRDAIASPVEGLIVYQTTNTPGVYYFDGSLWKNVSKVKADLSNLSATSINESLLPNATGTLDLGSTTLKWRDAYLSNIKFADGTTLSTAAGGGGGIGGSGTTSYIPKFTSSSAIGNSSIYDNAGLIGIGTTVPASKLHALATDLTTITAENTSTSGTSPITGVKSLLTSAATNSKTAYFGNITSSTSNIGVIRGLDLDISQSGIGQTYGLDIDITGSGGSSKYGISSSLNTSSTSDIKYGCYISVTDAKLHTQPSYGLRADVFGDGTGAKYGVYANMGTGGTGIRYGVYSNATGSTNYAGYFLGRGYFSDNVGIGTNAPGYRLHIDGGSDASLGSGGYVVTGSTTGTNVAIDNNEIMARNNGAASKLYLNNDGGDVSMCYSGGGVMIGSSYVPTGYLFAVDGNIICEELKVQLSSDWPDYVFEKDYSLHSISELKTFIEKNKHLPGIPTATEVKENGISVGDMQSKMMEKIEELSLYIIQLQHQIDELKVVNN